MIWYVAAGSAVGGVARFLLSGALERPGVFGLPHWTLIVNVSGSLLLGFLVRYFTDGASVTPEVRAMLTTGFCGGFTTFSTFSQETITLFQFGDVRRGVTYIFLSVGLSLLAVVAGMGAARAVAMRP